jgi:hypothetical protein
MKLELAFPIKTFTRTIKPVKIAKLCLKNTNMSTGSCSMSNKLINLRILLEDNKKNSNYDINILRCFITCAICNEVIRRKVGVDPPDLPR